MALALALLTAANAAAPTVGSTRSDRSLTRRLDQILTEPGWQHGFWGVYVYSLDRHRVLYDHNGERWFTPASNAKLFTLAAALELLGPNFRFHTPVTSTAAPDPSGLLAGDLVLHGVGDPSLSGRPYPYRPEPASPAEPYDPMLVPRRLAQQLWARGVRHIAGGVVGDASYFQFDPYPAGWAIGDEPWDYGAPVSALTLNDNTRFLELAPGAAVGDPVVARFDPAEPPSSAVALAVVTGPEGGHPDLQLAPAPDGGWRLSGSLPLGSTPILEALAVRQPALYAAELLRQALIAQGIAVDGPARARFVPAPPATEYELAGWDSPPLAEILQATAKLSQNLEAELLLRVLGKLHAAGASDEAAAGRAARHNFLLSAGLGPQDADLLDGSGLSRQDLVTPAGIVRLLRYMAARPEAAVWQGLLPVAARDGTLQHRFLRSAAAGRLEAKTGSLSHVNSLSGYVTTAAGEHLAFSLLSNNVDRPASEVRARLDRLAGALAR